VVAVVALMELRKVQQVLQEPLGVLVVVQDLLILQHLPKVYPVKEYLDKEMLEVLLPDIVLLMQGEEEEVQEQLGQMAEVLLPQMEVLE